MPNGFLIKLIRFAYALDALPPSTNMQAGQLIAPDMGFRAHSGFVFF
jgi:hypothetical protein